MMLFLSDRVIQTHFNKSVFFLDMMTVDTNAQRFHFVILIQTSFRHYLSPKIVVWFYVFRILYLAWADPGGQGPPPPLTRLKNRQDKGFLSNVVRIT